MFVKTQVGVVRVHKGRRMGLIGETFAVPVERVGHWDDGAHALHGEQAEEGERANAEHALRRAVRVLRGQVPPATPVVDVGEREREREQLHGELVLPRALALFLLLLFVAIVQWQEMLLLLLLLLMLVLLHVFDRVDLLVLNI